MRNESQFEIIDSPAKYTLDLLNPPRGPMVSLGEKPAARGQTIQIRLSAKELLGVAVGERLPVRLWANKRIQIKVRAEVSGRSIADASPPLASRAMSKKPLHSAVCCHSPVGKSTPTRTPSHLKTTLIARQSRAIWNMTVQAQVAVGQRSGRRWVRKRGSSGQSCRRGERTCAGAISKCNF